MRVIAVEEHFTTQAFRDANADHPFLRGMMAPMTGGGPPSQAAQAGAPQLVERLLDLGELRLASMDAAGIDVQVISQTTPGPENLELSLAVRLAAEANDVAAEAVAAHPDRFAAFAMLATPDPAAAAAELDRAVGSLGFVGAIVNGTVNGRYLDDQFFWPIFEAAEALDVPIYLHPAWPPQAAVDVLYTGFSPRVNASISNGGWGWHIDAGFHVLRLMLAGVFDRFPRLQIMLGHLGEALPFMIWRSGAVLDGSAGLERPLERYFAENVSATIGGFFHHAPFAAAMQTLGADRILFSVDYPYASNDDGIGFLDGLPVSPAEKAKIAHGNAERLLKLGPGSSG